MADLIKRALTRRRFQRGHFVDEEPDETLVYVVKFGMGMTACLSALEIANMAFLHSWNRSFQRHHRLNRGSCRRFCWAQIVG